MSVREPVAAGAQPLHVSRHGRWSDGSRSFAGYVEEATGFGDANPTNGLLLCMPARQFRLRRLGLCMSSLHKFGGTPARELQSANWPASPVEHRLAMTDDRHVVTS